MLYEILHISTLFLVLSIAVHSFMHLFASVFELHWEKLLEIGKGCSTISLLMLACWSSLFSALILIPVSSEYSVPLLGIVLCVLPHVAGDVLPVMVTEGPILLLPGSIPVGTDERSPWGKGDPPPAPGEAGADLLEHCGVGGRQWGGCRPVVDFDAEVKRPPGRSACPGSGQHCHSVVGSTATAAPQRGAWPWGRTGIGGGGVLPSPLGMGDGPDNRDEVRAGGSAAYLDAVAVEPGTGADGIDLGVIAGPPCHHLLANGAGDLVLLHCFHHCFQQKDLGDRGDTSASALLHPGTGSGPAR